MKTDLLHYTHTHNEGNRLLRYTHPWLWKQTCCTTHTHADGNRLLHYTHPWWREWTIQSTVKANVQSTVFTVCTCLHKYLPKKYNFAFSHLFDVAVALKLMSRSLKVVWLGNEYKYHAKCDFCYMYSFQANCNIWKFSPCTINLLLINTFIHFLLKSKTTTTEFHTTDISHNILHVLL